MAIQLQRRIFTVDEYHRMAEAGILTEDDRVELLNGEIVAMAPQGSLHVNAVINLTHLLTTYLGSRARVSVQNALTLGDISEPQPDVAILRRRSYAGRLPTSEDVLLLIEVSDTTLLSDRNEKLPAYARAGIPEVWIVDLNARRVELYRSPSPDGYRDLHFAVPGERIAPAAFPDVTLAVEEMLA